MDVDVAGHEGRKCFKGNLIFSHQWEFTLLNEYQEHLWIWPPVTGNAEEHWSIIQTKA